MAKRQPDDDHRSIQIHQRALSNVLSEGRLPKGKHDDDAEEWERLRNEKGPSPNPTSPNEGRWDPAAKRFRSRTGEPLDKWGYVLKATDTSGPRTSLLPQPSMGHLDRPSGRRDMRLPAEPDRKKR